MASQAKSAIATCLRGGSCGVALQEGDDMVKILSRHHPLDDVVLMLTALAAAMSAPGTIGSILAVELTLQGDKGSRAIQCIMST